MSIYDFPEPGIQQKVSVSIVLKELTVLYKNKERLSSILKDIDLPTDFKDDLVNFINEIKEEDSKYINLLFLFNFCVLKPHYFDDNELSSERIKIIPALFSQKAEGKPSVFKPYVANILYNIENCAKKDKNFSEAYQKKLQEIRASSSSAERTCFYIKQENLPKRTYDTGEKPPTFDEISLLFKAERKYPMCLIEKFEEIPMRDNEDIAALPFLVYGKEAFTSIRNALFLIIWPFGGDSYSLIEKIEIPKWDKENYIHEVFFELALKLNKNNKDTSMLILDKIFDGVNVADIPYIFFKYIEDNPNSTYGLLLKGGYSEVIEPIRAELEYIDWALITYVNETHEIHFNKSRLFLDYIDKLSYSAPKDKLKLFRELCFRRSSYTDPYPYQDKLWSFRQKTIKDILTSTEYDKFVDVIAKGAAKYPVKLFLPEERQNLSMQKQDDHGLIVFKRYCEKLELKTHEDAIFISEFWFKLFYLEQPFFSSVFLSSHRYSSKLEEEGPFFYNHIFSKFINDEDFIIRFFSILQDSSSSCSLAVYCLACWVLYQKNKDENMSDVFKKASRLLYDEKITFPDKIKTFIKSYKIPDGLSGNDYDNEAWQFLFYLITALEGEQFQNMLEKLYGVGKHFPLYYIKYNYSHENLLQEEFLDFLISLKDTNRWVNKNKFYNLELIQEACKKGMLKKQVVLEKVSAYIEINRKLLFESSEIIRLIKYFFIETEEGETIEAQTAFFTRFCERAVLETEDSYTEFYLFFRIWRDFQIDAILKKHTDINDLLVTRSCKMLNSFRKNIEKKNFPENEYTFLNDYLFPASDFICERTGNIWKALKPLILAFRASKDLLLDESLNTTDNISSMLLNKIYYFFRIEDQEKLKELRYNMANDFAEYLKPAKNERQAEKYTEKEQETPGFKLSYTEPNPYWQYAYIRALGDLAVKTDKRGHYFHKILEKVSEEKDLSEKVKSAAKKVMKELDSIRKGYSGANHKKCLFEAFWWLKNAHVLSLNGKIDNKKALELRIQEWR